MDLAFCDTVHQQGESGFKTRHELVADDITHKRPVLAYQAEELSALQQEQRAVLEAEKEQQRMLERLRRDTARGKERQRMQAAQLDTLWVARQEAEHVARLEQKLLLQERQLMQHQQLQQQQHQEQPPPRGGTGGGNVVEETQKKKLRLLLGVYGGLMTRKTRARG